MKAAVLSLSLAFVLFVPLTFGQDIATNAGISIQCTTIEYWGEAQYLNAQDQPASATMPGNLTLHEKFADYPAEVLDYYPWISYSGAWSGSGSYGWGTDDTCYNGATVARTNDVGDRRSDSGWGCTLPPPEPRQSHGYTLIIELQLVAERAHRYDDRGNILMFESRYRRAIVGDGGRRYVVERRLDDISFIPLDE